MLIFNNPAKRRWGPSGGDMRKKGWGGGSGYLNETPMGRWVRIPQWGGGSG